MWKNLFENRNKDYNTIIKELKKINIQLSKIKNNVRPFCKINVECFTVKEIDNEYKIFDYDYKEAREQNWIGAKNIKLPKKDNEETIVELQKKVFNQTVPLESLYIPDTYKSIYPNSIVYKKELKRVRVPKDLKIENEDPDNKIKFEDKDPFDKEWKFWDVYVFHNKKAWTYYKDSHWDWWPEE